MILGQGQEDDVEKRMSQLGGTHSPYNRDESGEVDKNDYLHFGGLEGNATYQVNDAKSTIEGPLCYLYAGTY